MVTGPLIISVGEILVGHPEMAPLSCETVYFQPNSPQDIPCGSNWNPKFTMPEIVLDRRIELSPFGCLKCGCYPAQR